MNKFLTATFVALLSTAVFSQGVIPEAYYIITGSEGQFTAKRGVYSAITNCGSNDPPNNCIPEYVTVEEANKSIQTVIDAIRADAVSYMGDRFLAHIQFGDLYISGDSVQFTGVGWGSIHLRGHIMSGNSSPTIKIGQGVSISSEAIIANLGGGNAIHNSGQLSIIGGTVSTANCGGNLGDPNSTCPQTSYPVYHDNEEFPLVLGGSPSIPPSSSGIPGSMAVSIYIASGKLKVVSDFAPSTEIYYIPDFAPGTEEIYRIRLKDDISAGRVVVVNGAAYADNFSLAYGGWGLGLVPSGDDLVIGEETAPIIKSKVASGFGIVLNGNSLQVVGISQATPVRVYDLRGNVVMSRTALPNESVSVSHLPKGVYVAKVGGMAVRVVR